MKSTVAFTTFQTPSKLNPQWNSFETAESLVIFTGAHAYISPALYEKYESVPTWNYIAVHAYGVPQILTLNNSQESMDRMIHEMIDTYETDYQAHWHSLSNQFREGMMNGIAVFEMLVTCLEGKYKLSQNRSKTDQQSVSKALLQSSYPTAWAVGYEIIQNLGANSDD